MNYDDYLKPSVAEDPDYAAAMQATRVPSQHAAVPTSVTVTGNPQVSHLRVGLEGLRLGEFDAQQMCFLRPLVRLAWAYLATMAEGHTMDALGLLEVYRSLYNARRDAIAPGFAPEMRALLPARLDEAAWTDPMRISIALVLGSLTGSTAARRERLAAIPASAGAIGSWFASIRGLFDESSLRTYLEVPRFGGEDFALSVRRAVEGDVAACLAPTSSVGSSGGSAPSSGFIVGPMAPLSPCPAGSMRVGGRCVSMQTTPGSGGGSRQNQSGGSSGGSGGGLLLGLVLVLAAAAYWVYLQDFKPRLSGADEE
jgi:hypothetical protein